ncbi:hypothetical protein G3H63_09290 [Microbacterium resistens]|uniref:hypothetical protein n=1 Tax=Microbacterium resistens TaxID=156977 RepID=UPI001C56B01E|nr:hypothetical protein [Microbacterium resistens]MBW1639263.1 hypothetical protein [Microbacterium resistens]
MSKLTIYGASDDLVEVEGEFREEFDAGRGWRGRVIAPDGDSLIVTAEYSKPHAFAEWTLGIENSGTWPSWPIRFIERPDREGDPAIEIDVPAGTVVEEITR